MPSYPTPVFTFHEHQCKKSVVVLVSKKRSRIMVQSKVHAFFSINFSWLWSKIYETGLFLHLFFVLANICFIFATFCIRFIL